MTTLSRLGIHLRGKLTEKAGHIAEKNGWAQRPWRMAIPRQSLSRPKGFQFCAAAYRGFYHKKRPSSIFFGRNGGPLIAHLAFCKHKRELCLLHCKEHGALFPPFVRSMRWGKAFFKETWGGTMSLEMCGFNYELSIFL